MDVGEGGYQVGSFPVLWTEWNGRCATPCVTSGAGPAPGWPTSPTGSPGPVTCTSPTAAALRQHQLRHLPRRLHPERPGQLQRQAQRGQRRGGPRRHRRQPLLELRDRGPTDDLEVVQLRERQKRNVLASLLSAGVPMLLAGDEFSRTQQGNNNAYCQDNEISWVDWELDENKEALIEFTRAIIELRRDHPVFRRRKFFQARPSTAPGQGHRLVHPGRPRDGRDPLAGPGHLHPRPVPQRRRAADRGPRGQRVADAGFLLLLNGGTEPALFTSPATPGPRSTSWSPTPAWPMSAPRRATPPATSPASS